MAKPKIVIMTVSELVDFFNFFISEGILSKNAKIWLSSDEKGNRISPFGSRDYVPDVEIPSKNKIVLYPMD